MSEFIVIDSPMGAGKSSWAIANIKRSPNPFIQFTPFLSETERVRNGADKQISLPFDGEKQKSFKRFIEEGRNIASTHVLLGKVKFEQIHEDIIRQMKYDCYIDEAIDAFHQIKLTAKQTKMIVETYLDVDEFGKCSLKKIDDEDDFNGCSEKESLMYEAWNKVIESAECGTLYLINNALFVEEFPVSKLMLFNRVFVMTYNFEWSTMAALMKKYDVKYSLWHVEENEDGYCIAEGKCDDREFKKKVSSLLHVYESEPGSKTILPHSLSKYWQDKAMRTDRKQIDSVKRAMYNVLRNKFKAKPSDVMWSTFADYVDKINPLRYPAESCYVACNCRGLNEYGNRHYMAYMLDVNYHSMVTSWLTQRNIPFDNDTYALSTLLQWIFRSAIRNGEDVWIYLPSQRMRELLMAWLEE